jgi:ribosomal protein S18 acetylase RimI-like enzyme
MVKLANRSEHHGMTVNAQRRSAPRPVPGTSILSYGDTHFAAVKTLWERSYPNDPPWNRAETVIPNKMATQPDLFVVALDGDEVVGAALAGYDGHRGWLYSVTVAGAHHRLGVGSALVRELEDRLAALGCHKINLQVRSLNMSLVSFYHSLGYASEDRVSMGRRLI